MSIVSLDWIGWDWMENAMVEVEGIAAQAGIKVLERSGLSLIYAKDAEELISALESTGSRILGIDGFTLATNAIVPDMDALADFSGSIADSRRFLSKQAAKVGDRYYCFTLA